MLDAVELPHGSPTDAPPRWRVALDARRQRDNGVARVTRLLAIALQKLPIEVVLLGPADELNHQFPDTEHVPYDAPLLSQRDFGHLDEILTAHRIDLFVAPQFYNSPNTTCPQIRLLHDTFPIDHHASRPSLADVEKMFGKSNVQTLRRSLLEEPSGSDDDVTERMYRAFYDASVQKASVLFTVSEQSKDSLLEFYPEVAEKLYVLPLFPDPALTGGPHGPASRRPVDALHVSKFEPRKNQLALIDAWAAVWQGHATFRAVIVGAPSDLYPDYASQLYDRVKAGTRDGWLVHESKIDDTRLSELYRSTKAVCVPSSAEGYGLPALEAIANGCVVIALPGTAVEEVVGSVARYVDGSVASIASGVQSVVRAPHLDDLSRASANRAAGYVAERTAHALYDAIRRALDPS
jgi:glycosyltransferase involved in cell wall biosynthesis